MNDEKLRELLTSLIFVTEDVIYANNAGAGYNETDILILKRSGIYNTVMEGFAALRQQQNELAGACKDLITEVEESVSLGLVPSTVWAILNVLTSIEEAE